MAKAPVNEQGVEFTNAIAAAMRDGTLKGEDYAKFRAVLNDPSVDPWIRQELAKADAFRYGMPYKDPTAGYAPGNELSLGGNQSSADQIRQQNLAKLQAGLDAKPPGGWNGHGSTNPPGSPGYTPPGGGGNTTGGGGGQGPIGDPWTPTEQAPVEIDWSGLQAPKEGWEASTNKDFYQDQFAGLRTQKNVEGAYALAAALRRQQAEQADPAPSDPWQWANLPTVVRGTGAGAADGGSTPQVEWGLNPNYNWNEDTTNQQILADLNPLFTDADQVYLNKHPEYLTNGPQWTTAGREETYNYLNNNPYPNDKGWTTVLNKLNNNIYQQLATAGATPTGQTVPVGYASPTNL